MANPTTGFGLKPVRHLSGHDWNGHVRPYYIPDDYGSNVFIGDPVVIVGDSNDAEVTHIGGRFAPWTLSEVNLSTGADGTTITGVVVGFMPTNRESTIYGAANTERIALVCDDPSVIFQVRDDGGGTLSADTVGLNASLEDATAGSTVTGLSGYMLDGGTTTAPATDVSQPLLIIGLANIEGNEAADNAIWEVIISAHTYGARPITGIA